MDVQHIVREKYPTAEARENKPVFEMGRQSPIAKGYWAIHAGPGLGDPELGRGATEDQAWTEAATIVLKSLRKPTSVEITAEKVQDALIQGTLGTLRASLDDLNEETQVKIERADGSKVDLPKKPVE